MSGPTCLQLSFFPVVTATRVPAILKAALNILTDNEAVLKHGMKPMSYGGKLWFSDSANDRLLREL